MKEITIGFSTPKKFNLLSCLIKKIQGTEYSHVYVKFYSTNLDREIIYQASGLQVNFVGSKLFNDKHITTKEYKLTVEDEAYKNALVFAIDNAGKPYSAKQLLHILIYSLTGKDTYFDENLDGYICSELVANLIKNSLGIPIEIDLNLITPKDIDKLLETVYGSPQQK